MPNEQSIDFGFTDEMKMLRQSVRDSDVAQILPQVMKLDGVQEFPMAIVRQTVELGYLGVYGFIKDSHVEKFYRDAKLLTIGEETSEIQKMVLAENLLQT